MYKIPAILRWHEITWRVEPIQAKLNLASVFREKAHLRDPALIDAWVTRGYERLIEAEQHHTYSSHLYQFLTPNVKNFSFLFLWFLNVNSNFLTIKDSHIWMKRNSREKLNF